MTAACERRRPSHPGASRRLDVTSRHVTSLVITSTAHVPTPLYSYSFSHTLSPPFLFFSTTFFPFSPSTQQTDDETHTACVVFSPFLSSFLQTSSLLAPPSLQTASCDFSATLSARRTSSTTLLQGNLPFHLLLRAVPRCSFPPLSPCNERKSVR